MRKITINAVNNLVFEFDYNPDIISEIKCNFDRRRWNPDTKKWWAPATASNIRHAQNLAVTWGFEFKSSEENVETEETVKSEETVEKYSTEELVAQNPTSMPHQLEAIGFLISHAKCILADDMGLGKTHNLIRASICVGAEQIVIIAPACVKTTWRREIERWDPDFKQITIYSGKTKKSHIEIEGVGDKREYLILNYDIAGAHLTDIKRADTAILDESQYVKNQQALRTKSIAQWLKSINPSRIWLATGTPVMNRPIELVSPLSMILNFKREFGSYFSFGKKYCNAYEKHIGYGNTVWDFSGTSNLGELHQRLSHVMIRRTRKEALGDAIRKNSPVTIPVNGFTPAAIEVDDDDVNSFRHRQRHVMKKRVEAGEAKIDHAIAWIKNYQEVQPDNSLVVFCHHISVAQALAVKFNIEAYTGETSQDERDKLVSDFQSGETKLFIATTLSAGVGITLTKSSDVLFTEYEFRPSDHWQAEDRLARIGQDNIVQPYYLHLENSIDNAMAKLIEKKSHIIHSITDGVDVSELDNEVNDIDFLWGEIS